MSMAFTKLFDLSLEVDGERVNLEQDAGCGEVHRMELHVMHVRLLASEMGLMQGDANAWRRVATLERRMRVLCDRICALDDRLWAVPVYPPGGNSEDANNIYSDATRDLAIEFCADLEQHGDDDSEPRTQANASERETQAEPKGNPGKTAGFPAAQAALPLEGNR
jgi:hypothetical protein